MTAAGADVTEQCKKGAEEALLGSQFFEWWAAVLKKEALLRTGGFMRERYQKADGRRCFSFWSRRRDLFLERLPAANAKISVVLKQGKNKKNKSSYRRDEKTVI